MAPFNSKPCGGLIYYVGGKEFLIKNLNVRTPKDRETSYSGMVFLRSSMKNLVNLAYLKITFDSFLSCHFQLTILSSVASSFQVLDLTGL
jgi:hypothetical protein